MSINRPMNEYEGALFSAIMILIKEVVLLGSDRTGLADKFREAADSARQDNRETDAAVHDILAEIAERDTFYVPNTRLTLIKGEKDD